MGRYCRIETSVQKAGDHLPKHFYEANPPEVSVIPLGNQDNCLPGALVVQRPIVER